METTPVTIANGQRYGRNGSPVAVGPLATLADAHKTGLAVTVTDGIFEGETVHLATRESISWGRIQAVGALHTWTPTAGPYAGIEMGAYLVDTSRLADAPKLADANNRAAARINADPNSMRSMTARAAAEERALSRDAD